MCAYPRSSLTAGLASLDGDAELVKTALRNHYAVPGLGEGRPLRRLVGSYDRMEYLLTFFEEHKLIFSPLDPGANKPRNAQASVATSMIF